MTEHITEGDIFYVKAVTEIDGINFEETATVSHYAAGRSTIAQ